MQNQFFAESITMVSLNEFILVLCVTNLCLICILQEDLLFYLSCGQLMLFGFSEKHFINLNLKNNLKSDNVYQLLRNSTYVILYFYIYMFYHHQNLFLDVIRSGIGALVWMVIFISWTCVFQINRASWGELGDQLSFVIPRGIP